MLIVYRLYKLQSLADDDDAAAAAAADDDDPAVPAVASGLVAVVMLLQRRVVYAKSMKAAVNQMLFIGGKGGTYRDTMVPAPYH